MDVLWMFYGCLWMFMDAFWNFELFHTGPRVGTHTHTGPSGITHIYIYMHQYYNDKGVYL